MLPFKVVLLQQPTLLAEHQVVFLYKFPLVVHHLLLQVPQDSCYKVKAPQVRLLIPVQYMLDMHKVWRPLVVKAQVRYTIQHLSTTTLAQQIPQVLPLD